MCSLILQAENDRMSLLKCSTFNCSSPKMEWWSQYFSLNFQWQKTIKKPLCSFVAPKISGTEDGGSGHDDGQHVQHDERHAQFRDHRRGATARTARTARARRARSGGLASVPIRKNTIRWHHGDGIMATRNSHTELDNLWLFRIINMGCSIVWLPEKMWCILCRHSTKVPKVTVKAPCGGPKNYGFVGWPSWLTT